MLACRTVSVSINASFDDVYEFSHKAENYEKWVAELEGLQCTAHHEWVTSVGGVTFTPYNSHGVLDYFIQVPGAMLHTAIRLLRNEEGCVAMTTIFRPEDTPEGIFAEGTAGAAKDLLKLKTLMEPDMSSVVRVDFQPKRK
ncbi:hypothetical protein EON80_21305 [bacterium]|nr:MAG: hypothetical protein EON80_21305 [bacterium]